jgi:hypothetical protein
MLILRELALSQLSHRGVTKINLKLVASQAISALTHLIAPWQRVEKVAGDTPGESRRVTARQQDHRLRCPPESLAIVQDVGA